MRSGEERGSALQAYHDGELRGLRLWWWTWRLRRDPALRAELRALHSISDWVRGSQPEPSPPPLWNTLAPRLATVDAEVAGVQRQTSSPLWSWRWSFLALPVSVAAIVILALFFVLSHPQSSQAGVVRSLDTRGHRILVLSLSEDTTVIWVLDAPSEGSAGDGDAQR